LPSICVAGKSPSSQLIFMECEEVRKEHPLEYIEPCCISCHEDADEGYGEDLWFLDENGKLRFVCCSVGRFLDGEGK
jgi:hypothetical protein